ncbi:leucine-rich repeat and calponin homology domain-containing protein 4 isoform X4 [Anolis sagrei]|uniref:leucine-rich repeat and calponin homology domain-containing protein 4 isoform X4 n=1 Tax=Anolis sagrei TaxID=38937 RepID=UPI003520C755
MAAGEGGAEALPPPSPTSGPERALEEAAASGKLSLAGRRLRHFPGGAARRWDLSDTTQADLSRNRFAEVPEDACHLMSLEGLSLYHNCLRSIPAAIANLQALTYLNLSRNQLTSLPSCVCRLPLKVLIASNNKLASLPEDIGALRSLRQLDVSSNELQSLPSSVGGLESLRDLNLRKNQITCLPEELAELPLVRLDFSCNRVTRIPVCFRHLRHLQSILLENNPLQCPPAQICLKGKIHIFKYLHIEACSKGRPDLAEFARGSRPTAFGTCLPDDFYPVWQYGGLDSGFNSVDSGSKRWSGNESADEFSDLSFRIAELARDPRQLKERRNGAVDGGDLDQVDYIDSSLNGEEEEEDLAAAEGKSDNGFHGMPSIEEQQRAGRSAFLKGGPASESGLTSSSILAESGSSSFSQLRHRMGKGSEQLSGSFRQSPPHYADPCHSQSANSLSREAGSVQRPPSFLFRSGSRHSTHRGASGCFSPDSPSEPWRPRPLDERELVHELRKAIESHLNITLAEDLGEALANGVVLCQLVNHLHPRSVPFIHVPSPAVPKLNVVKSRKNVENFLAACRQLGVPEVSLCSASEVLFLPKGLSRGLLLLLEALLLMRAPPAGKPLALPALSRPPAGFGAFYVLVMLLLYLAYRKLWG